MQEGRYRKNIFLAAYMLVGGKIGYDVKWPFAQEQLFKNRVAKVERISQKMLRDMIAQAASQVAHQFREAVFIQVHHQQPCGSELQQRLYEGRANAASPADDEHRMPVDSLGQCIVASFQVCLEKAGVAAGNVLGEEK